MRGQDKKKIIIATLLLIICAAAIGFYMYNKGPVDVKNSTALKTEAAALYDAYVTDSAAAQKKYSGKVLLVHGIVSKVSDNQLGEMIVLIKTNDDAAFVNCTLQQKTADINPNETIQVKGICSGIGQGEPDLGIKGDVYLTQSLIVE
ncbi:MAG TPA: hypothetical protein VLR49_05460 [Ferruginibacter sp.]|nr:hypothetical protein [Ferruginibacter sp.]